MSAFQFQKFINTVLQQFDGKQIDKLSFQKHQQEIYKTIGTMAPFTGITTLSAGVSGTITPKDQTGTIIPLSGTSVIFATAQDDNSTGAIRGVITGQTFKIKSSSNTDSGVVAWLLVP